MPRWGRGTPRGVAKRARGRALTGWVSGGYGQFLRAKGMVDGGSTWDEFDMVPGEYEIREATPDVTGKLCVIGSDLKEHAVAELFGV